MRRTVPTLVNWPPMRIFWSGWMDTALTGPLAPAPGAKE